MTQEEKAKAYDEAIKRAKAMIKVAANQDESIGFANTIFPELKESEDEKIRKELLESFKYQQRESRTDKEWLNGIKLSEVVAWLEKQGESYTKRDVDNAFVEGMALAKDELEKQGGIDNYPLEGSINTVMTDSKKNQVEPKFKVGDWVVNTVGDTNQVVKVWDDGYTLDNNVFLSNSWATEHYHLWTIQDAKDGDVLQLGEVTAIFKKHIGQEKCICYCSVCEGEFEIPIENGEDNIYGCTNTTPATKEQRDTLMKAITDAGYEWDAELKKVSKITTPADVGFAELGKAWKKEAKDKKPAWSEEDENFFKTALCYISYSIINGESTDIHCDTIEWLKSVKQRLGGEK